MLSNGQRTFIIRGILQWYDNMLNASYYTTMIMIKQSLYCLLSYCIPRWEYWWQFNKYEIWWWIKFSVRSTTTGHVSSAPSLQVLESKFLIFRDQDHQQCVELETIEIIIRELENRTTIFETWVTWIWKKKRVDIRLAILFSKFMKPFMKKSLLSLI